MVEDDSLKLYFENIEANNSNIEVTGTGSLTIFVKTLDFQGDILGDSDVKILFKVIDDLDNDFEVGLQTGNASAELFFYGPYADFNLRAGCELTGSIVGNNVELESGANIYFDETTGEFSPRIDIDMYSYEFLSMSEE